jgi:ABC-type Mn2+/Zn2+ transport system ATPase subunit
MPMQKDYALELSNVTVEQDHHIILDSVSVQIKAGSLVAIVGPNGAGKTTLLETILGFKKQSKGTITILGQENIYQKNQCAYIPQRSSLDWDFPINVFDFVIMGTYGKLGWFYRPGADQYRQVYKALEDIDMLDCKDRPIGHLSGGQKQRLFIARALVQEASLYFLDEPFVGIDHTTESSIIKKLHQLRDQHNTIIVVHHDLRTVADYFDYILLLNKQCIAYGTTQEVLQQKYMLTAFKNKSLFTHSFE